MTNQKLSSRQRTTMVIIMLLGGFIALLTETFMNNALPSIMHSLNVSQATAQWLSTGYLMVAGLMIPISAWIFQRFPVRWSFSIMMLIFLAGSVIGYLAPNFAGVLAGRLIQAVAAGSIMPLINNVILIVYPPKSRGTAMGMTGIVIAFAPAIGPTLSGWIIDNLGWRDLFGILIPLAFLIWLAGMLAVKNINQTTPVKLDLASLFSALLGFGSLLYSFSIVGNDGRITSSVLIAFLIGVIVTAMFVKRQSTAANPMIKLGVFKNRTFVITTILSALSNIALVGVELVMPLYLQNVHHVSALTSGLVLLPGAIIMGIMNPIAGSLYDRLGIRKLSLAGYGILLLATLPMAWFSSQTSLIVIILLYALRIFGIALVMMPTFTSGINALDQKLAVDGNAASSTVRQIAGSLGTALLMMTVSLCSTGATHTLALANGYHAAYLFASLMALIGFILSFKLHNNE